MKKTQQVKSCPMDWCDEEDISDFKCHYCHDGEDITEACPLDEWKVVYKVDYGNDEEETLMYECPNCKVEYYNNFYNKNATVGGSEWKVLPDGTHIDKLQPHNEDKPFEPQRCNY